MSEPWDLTAEEEAAGRAAAAAEGADPDRYIADGRAAKYEGYLGAYQHAQGAIDRIGGATSQMYGGNHPGADPAEIDGPEAG